MTADNSPLARAKRLLEHENSFAVQKGQLAALIALAEHVKRIADALEQIEVVDGAITVHSFSEPYT